MVEKMSHAIAAAALLCAKLLPIVRHLGALAVNANRGQFKPNPDKIVGWE
jgi:hypothetical protein